MSCLHSRKSDAIQSSRTIQNQQNISFPREIDPFNSLVRYLQNTSLVLASRIRQGADTRFLFTSIAFHLWVRPLPFRKQVSKACSHLMFPHSPTVSDHSQSPHIHHAVPLVTNSHTPACQSLTGDTLPLPVLIAATTIEAQVTPTNRGNLPSRGVSHRPRIIEGSTRRMPASRLALQYPGTSFPRSTSISCPLESRQKCGDQ